MEVSISNNVLDIQRIQRKYFEFPKQRTKTTKVQKQERLQLASRNSGINKNMLCAPIL